METPEQADKKHESGFLQQVQGCLANAKQIFNYSHLPKQTLFEYGSLIPMCEENRWAKFSSQPRQAQRTQFDCFFACLETCYNL